MTSKLTPGPNVRPAPAQSGEIRSPCCGKCRLDRTCVPHLCRGCLRTLEEIAGWGGLSSEERETVLQALPLRASKG